MHDLLKSCRSVPVGGMAIPILFGQACSTFRYATFEVSSETATYSLSRYTTMEIQAAREGFDVDCKFFGYFLWTKTQRYDQGSQNAVVLAYQPPWILSQTDFEGFIKCGSVYMLSSYKDKYWNLQLPLHMPPGHLYPSDLQSEHKIWAKVSISVDELYSPHPGQLWDTCVKYNTKWFVITSWNIWAFGCFSDGERYIASSYSSCWLV